MLKEWTWMEKIILYYKYLSIYKPKALVDAQRSLCQKLGLRGRIIIATEGINGTLGGSEEAIELYKKTMNADPQFVDIDYKESNGSKNDFPRLTVKHKNEIVRLDIASENAPIKDRGEYLTPQEFHAKLTQKNPNLVLLDARNAYESRIGTFVGAVTPSIKTFRELPTYLDTHKEQFKNKEVIMFCTGGVRCERATAYVKKQHIATKVYHLKGGIHRYLEAYPDGFFRGKNFVFDGRMAMATNNDCLTQCDTCTTPYDTYSHCQYQPCHNLIIQCPSCQNSLNHCCSKQCQQALNSQLT